jgi:hypothetical protein
MDASSPLGALSPKGGGPKSSKYRTKTEFPIEMLTNRYVRRTTHKWKKDIYVGGFRRRKVVNTISLYVYIYIIYYVLLYEVGTSIQLMWDGCINV